MARARREVWAKRVARWRESGLTAKEFASEIGVNANTLANWRWKLAQSETARHQETASIPQRDTAPASNPPASAAPVQFVELVGVAPTRGVVEERIEIVLAGATVRVPSRFDEGALRRVLCAVAAR